MRIKNIIGNADHTLRREERVALRQAAGGEGVTVDTVRIQEGPLRLECTYEERLAAPHILEEVRQAERDGYDAVTLDCFGDPAKRAARELVDIPVVGPGETGMLFAMALGDKFSVVTVQNGVQWMEENIRIYGFQEWVASVRAVDIESRDLMGDSPVTEEALFLEASKAVEEDGADVIVLGCTGMSAWTRSLSERLGVPVIDPASCGIKLARSLVEMGLSHSRRCYLRPPKREPQPTKE